MSDLFDVPRFAVASHDETVDVLNLLFLRAFTAGEQPHAARKNLQQISPEATLLPTANYRIRQADQEYRHSHLAIGDGWTLLAHRHRDRTGTVDVTAVDAELAARILKEATEGAEDPRAEGTVPIGFWHYSQGSGPVRNLRPITAPHWPDIRRNYSKRVADSIDKLAAVTPDDIYGRLLLLYGVPGTGKTTALRALAREWQAWCQVDCVLDPDQLFERTDYLMEVAVGEDDDEDGRRWRLLILEDCDELIRGEAKYSSGQALSRLLNLTDGLLGQGRDVLVAITTNEDISRLHSAVTRPGRSLAHFEVDPLPYDQAVSWLGTTVGVPSGGMTLAELFAVKSGREIPDSDGNASGGLYM